MIVSYPQEECNMKQLKLIRRNEPLSERLLPEGYTFEFFDGSDEMIRDWVDICTHGLLGEGTGAGAFHTCITNFPGCDPKKDTFFVVDPNGNRVATSTSISHQCGDGYIHMVANKTECRGLGIGHAMLYFGSKILLDRGHKKIFLTTDDHRLAAIKTYLDGGFCPAMWHDDESDMKQRWDDVIKALRYTRPVTYLDDCE